jgi:cytoskeletal protein RodZ
LGALGQKLKAEREKRKIALEEIAVATKIGTRMLHALEEEKFELLPGGIFNKNFVRIYAHYLGLDEQQAVADYMAAAGPAPEPAPEGQELRAIAERKEKEQHRPKSAGVPWGMVTVLLLVIAFGISVWGFYSRDRAAAVHQLGNDRSTRSAAVLVGVDSVSEAATLQTATFTSDEVPTPVNVASVEGNSRPRSPAERGAVAENIKAEASPSSTESASVAGGSFSVSVTARDNSWLTLTADGNVLHHGMFSAPNQKTLEAQKEIVVKAGNIGALEISFNGKKLPQLGGDGEVKVLTFHANGLEPQ